MFSDMSPQARIGLAGLTLAIMFALFPPWVETRVYGSTKYENAWGHRLIFSPPQLTSSKGWVHLYRIDYSRLFLTWFIVGATTGAVAFVFRERPSLPRLGGAAPAASQGRAHSR